MLLAAVTGARRSEILGISWDDVDLKEGTISIRRGVQPVRQAHRTHTAAFTPLKTKRSRRVVQLPPFAIERIRRHRREQLGRRIALGPGWHDPLDELGRPVALVCDRGDGFFLYPDSFSSAFKRLARQAGMHPSTRLHDVRHAVATELGRRGVHPVIVSAVLGHASPAFTVAVYQHAWQEGPAEAAAALEAALRPAQRLASRWHERQWSGPEIRYSSRSGRSEEWGGEDLNLRPTDYESGAIHGAGQRRNLVFDRRVWILNATPCFAMLRGRSRDKCGTQHLSGAYLRWDGGLRSRVPLRVRTGSTSPGAIVLRRTHTTQAASLITHPTATFGINERDFETDVVERIQPPNYVIARADRYRVDLLPRSQHVNGRLGRARSRLDQAVVDWLLSVVLHMKDQLEVACLT